MLLGSVGAGEGGTHLPETGPGGGRGQQTGLRPSSTFEAEARKEEEGRHIFVAFFFFFFLTMTPRGQVRPRGAPHLC